MALSFAPLASSVCSRLKVLASRSSVMVLAGVVGLAGSAAASAQTTAPILMPNTFSTVAGGATAVCAAATDVYGNGCPATQAILGFDLFAGVVVDNQGNLYIDDANNYTTSSAVQMLRKVDGKSGIITSVISSSNGICSAATGTALGSTSTLGDGCPFATAKFNKERGIAIDPYGNVLLAGYGNSDVRIICNAVSPLCPVAAGVTQSYATAQKQVGNVYRIAGCTSGTSGAPTSVAGTTAGSAGDGYYASPFGDLPGDVAAWGTPNGSFTPTGTAAITTYGVSTSACGTTTGGVATPRGISADIYGNVYIADTANTRYRVVVGPPTYTLANGTTLTNPLPAILQLNSTYAGFTAAQMYGRIFPILGGYTSPASAAACGVAGNTSVDIYGDNCPFYLTSTKASTSSDALGTAISATGDFLVQDATMKLLRVLYMGPTVSGTAALQALTPASNQMAYAIYKNNNSLTSINPGYVYILAGGGASGYSATPTLGTKTILGNNVYRVATGPNGNLYLGDGGGSSTADIQFYDMSTGYVRTIVSSSGGTSATSTGTIGGDSAGTVYYCPTPGTGDGAAAATGSGVTTNACFNSNGGGSGSMGISVDAANNIYLADTEPNSTGTVSYSRIRKISAGMVSAPLATGNSATAIGATSTATLRIHAPVGFLTGSGTSVTSSTFNAGAGLSIAAPVCLSGAADATVECYATATFTPTVPGLSAATLALKPNAATTGIGTTVNSANFPVTAVASGSALVADPTALATPTINNVIGTGTTPVSVALDTAGDVFTVDTTAHTFDKISGGTVTTLAGTPPTTPSQLAVDAAGNVYSVGTGATTVTKLTLGTTGSYTASSFSITGVAAPQAVALDQQGNLFVADATTTSVYEVAAATLTAGAPFAYQPNATVATGFGNPTGLAVDGNGNVFVADTSANKIVKIAAGTGAQTTVATGVHPVSIAADTGGDVYYQDSTSKNVVEVPASGASVTVLASLTTPSGLAVATSGNVYSADTGAGTLTLVSRNALTYDFGTTAGTTFGATVTNVGNLASTSLTATDPTEFAIASGTGTGCGKITASSNTTTPLAPGAACTLTSTFTTAAGSSNTSSTNNFANAAQTGFFKLTGTQGGTVAPTTSLTLATSPTAGVTSATYVPGTELTYAVAVTAGDGSTPNGSVGITITNTTSGTTVATGSATLSGGSGTYNVTGLPVIAGTYTIAASYTGTGYQASNTPTATFSILQATPVVTWTPTASTQQFSAPMATLGSTFFSNATATYNSTPVPGVFVYHAGPTEVNAASYLAVGNYSLTATFYPTDAVDYASGVTTSGAPYSVTQASTSAAIGGTQTLVAADGTGNYTSIQAAINAVGVSGGSVYIKPGTYSGFLTVTQPNVALRGLGGDPTQVILTNSSGAFNNGQAQNAGVGAFANVQLNGSQLTAGSGGSSTGLPFTGDEGSATLVVARGINTALSSSATTPNNFYAEDLTLQNTYNTDATTTTSTFTVGNACTANAGTAQTYAYLYNNGIQCASQALAIWITSDTAVLNNVYTTSAQDTIYAGSISSGTYPARQYWFRGKVTGNVDYIFGDAAAVFDHTSIYTTIHYSGSNDGTETIEAQNSSSPSFLSGYVMNGDVFTSQAPGMNTGTSNANLYFGRPYGQYSTYIMLNSLIDQVSAAGYTPFSGSYALTNATYGEYNDSAYTDPATGQPDANGVIYSGSGGNSGSGVLPLSARESASATDPAAAAPFSASSSNGVAMTAAQAQQFYPLAFLGKTIGTNSYNTVATWNPTGAIAADVNAFVPGSSPASIGYGQTVTLLMRPQTPGLGAVGNGTYTVPTGTYTLYDAGQQVATGSLDASGEAYFTTAALTAGAHSFTWAYGGDSNFAGSTTSTAYALSVVGLTPVVTVSSTTNPIAYGQAASITLVVSGSGATPTGTVSVSVDGSVTSGSPYSLSNGSATAVISGLSAGSHSITATYSGNTVYAAGSSASPYNLTVQQATLNIAGTCSNRAFYTANSCSVSVSGYAPGDSASMVFSMAPVATTSAVKSSPAGSYPTSAAYTLTTAGSTNYTVVNTPGSFTITGSGNAAQSIIFAPLPNLPSGTWQLSARSTSGLAITYTVTGTGASINGSTLTLSGATGNIIQVTATATDTKGDYATATAVRSFTAQ